MKVERFERWVGVIALLLLNGCGGGGGGGSEASTSQAASGPTTVVFDQAVVRSTHVVRQYAGGSVPLNFKFRLNPVPTEPIYPMVVTSSTALVQAGTLVGGQNADGSFGAGIWSDPTLGAGSYTGTLTLRICKDQYCIKEYTLANNAVPFALTLMAPPRITLMASNATSGSFAAQVSPYVNVNSFDLAGRSIVTLQSDAPMTWTFDPPNPAGWTVMSITPTSLSIVVESKIGWFNIRAASMDVPDFTYNTQIMTHFVP